MTTTKTLYWWAIPGGLPFETIESVGKKKLNLTPKWDQAKRFVINTLISETIILDLYPYDKRDEEHPPPQGYLLPILRVPRWASDTSGVDKNEVRFYA